MILNSPYISGSLTVTGNIISSGSITISGSIASASFATTSSFATTASYSVSSSYALSGSYSFNATTASNSLTASSADNFFVRQNLTASSALFTGSITAQTLVVQTVTSSIVYSSGSNIFGNQLTDTQRFTGSMFITGSTLNVNGGSICATQNMCIGGMGIVASCLGIGTSSPSTALHISSSATQITLQNNAGGTNARRIGMNMTSGDTFKILSLCDNNTTRVDNIIVANVLSGNIGINTASPSGKLDISGSLGNFYVGTSGAELFFTRNENNDFLANAGSSAGIRLGAQSYLRFDTGTTLTERMRITSAGIACFACQVCAPQASFVGPYVQNTVALNAAWAGVGGFTVTLTCASGVQPYATYTFGNGNVVISTNNPTIRFQTITTTTADMMQIVGASYVSSGPYNCNKISALNSSHLSLETGGSSRMLIDSDGNVVVGSTTSLSLTCGGVFQVNSPWGMSITNGGQALRLIRSGVNMWQIGQGVFTSQTGFGISDVTSNVNAFFIQQTTGNVGINCTAPAYPLHVNGQIYSSNTVSAANSRILNQQSSNTWTNNSANTVNTAIPEVSGIIRVINNLDGTNTDVPFYAAGGSGDAYRWTVLDPDTGWLINQAGWNFNFTTNGSSPRTFNLQAINGSGNVIIQQASGTANYTMKIFIYSQA